MSFNLRYASDHEPNSWARRRRVVAELLRVELPTLLGTQEGLAAQLRDVRADLPEYYDRIGVGREGADRGEFMAIFYDTRRLTAVASDHFWLSDLPEVVGSSTWGNGSVRMATWVRFADRRTGAGFFALNTHLDNVSEYARVRGAELLRDRIEVLAQGLPVVLTGDFNAAAENSVPYEILTGGAGLADTWRVATEHCSPPYATWHGYAAPVPDGARIDWILVGGAVTVLAAGINTFARNGQFPSDHLPVQALLRWE